MFRAIRNLVFWALLTHSTIDPLTASQGFVSHQKTYWTVFSDFGLLVGIDRKNQLRTIDIGGKPSSLASVNSSIWVGDFEQSRIIEITGLEAQTTIKPYQLAYGFLPSDIEPAPPGQGEIQAISYGKGEVHTFTKTGELANKLQFENAQGLWKWSLDQTINQGHITPLKIRGDSLFWYRTNSKSVAKGKTNNKVKASKLRFNNIYKEAAVQNFPLLTYFEAKNNTFIIGGVLQNMGVGIYRNGRSPKAVDLILSTLIGYGQNGKVKWRMDFPNHNIPAGFTKIAGDKALISFIGSNSIVKIDLLQKKLLMERKGLCSGPDALVARSEKSVLVRCRLEPAVLEIDPVTLKTLNRSPISQQKIAEAVLKGKRIFYNAGDHRMSIIGNLSCASCHFEAMDDGRTWDFGHMGEGLRNTMSLVGRGGLSHGRLHWTGNFDEIQDFEQDIRLNFGGKGFLSDKQFAKIPNSLQEQRAGLSIELDHLAAYLNSLIKFRQNPNRQPDGTYTFSALRGKHVFRSSGCDDCHGGPNLTDSKLHKAVLHDMGGLTKASGKRLGKKLVGFDTPGLAGLWDTAPYLHDGKAESLKNVFDLKHAANGHDYLPNLTKTEMADLMRFQMELGEPVEPNLLDWIDGKHILETSNNQPLTDKVVVFSKDLNQLVFHLGKDTRARVIPNNNQSAPPGWKPSNGTTKRFFERSLKAGSFSTSGFKGSGNVILYKVTK